MQTYLEQAFGKSDCSSVKMRGAVREWMDLYYGASRSGEDGSARLAVLIVSKLCRTVFAEYDVHRDKHDDWAQECYTDALNKVAKTAMQYALIGGECLLKVVDDHFVPIRRDCYLPLGRDDRGNLTSVGMMQTLYENGKKYVLLERRTDIDDNTLIENRLFEVNGQALGRRVPLDTLTACKMLSDDEFLPNVPCMGLAVLRMPTVNCVDGSADPVSIYAPAVGLMHALARCEDQLNHEFLNGASRVFASEDLRGARAAGRPVCGPARRPRQRGCDRVQPHSAGGQLPGPQAGYFAKLREFVEPAPRHFERDQRRDPAPHRYRNYRCQR